MDGPQMQVAGGEITAVRHLTKRFGSSAAPVVALSDIDFSVNEGELVVGPDRLRQINFVAYPCRSVTVTEGERLCTDPRSTALSYCASDGRNTCYRAARYALPGRDFHPLDRASFT